MEAKLRAIATVYEDFEPAAELVREEDCDTLLLFLPDFKKEHLKVQLISTGSLIISGERQVERNKWSRFKKQLTISTNCDAQKISARFDGSILYVKQPKLITPAENKDKAKPTIEAPEPRKPENDQPQPQKNDQEPDGQKTASMTALARRVNEKPNELDTAKMVAEKRNGLVDSKNVSEKASDREKTNPENAPEKAIEKEKNSGTPQDQKVSRDTSEKHENSSVNDDTRRQEGAYGKKADSGKARLEDTKLKMIKRVMNMVLVILFALLLGLYLTNLIRSWKKGEN